MQAAGGAAGRARLRPRRPAACGRAPPRAARPAREAQARPVLAPAVAPGHRRHLRAVHRRSARRHASLPDVDVPFAASHEIAHQRGLAREDEANYAGLRRLPRPPGRGVPLLGRADLEPVRAGRARSRSTGRPPRRSRARAARPPGATCARWPSGRKRYRSRLTDVSDRVNDTYLREPGAAAGGAQLRRHGRPAAGRAAHGGALTEVAPQDLHRGHRGDGRGLRAQDARSEADAAAKPAARTCSTSRGSQPPAGPTSSSTRCGRRQRPRAALARARLQEQQLAAREGLAPAARPGSSVGATRGTTARPHCSAAPLATFSQRSWREPCSAGRAAASVRTVTTGRISATPSSVAFWIDQLHAVALQRRQRRATMRSGDSGRGSAPAPRCGRHLAAASPLSSVASNSAPGAVEDAHGRARRAGAAPRARGGRSARAA